ncbi:MAG: GNAT family N-acetyltransferase [Pseudomonadota bacterium]
MSDSEIPVQLLDWSQVKPLAEQVRRRVFIDEQGVPESEEWDRHDDFAVHALVVIDGEVVATGRLTREPKIGRMAVLPEHRGKSIGTAVLEALLHAARERGLPSVNLHAQVTAAPFYQRFGFVAEGEPFDEVDIPHQKMRLDL